MIENDLCEDVGGEFTVRTSTMVFIGQSIKMQHSNGFIFSEAPVHLTPAPFSAIGRKTPFVMLALGGCLLTLGCAKIQTWMGLRIPLEKVPVVALQASLAEGTRMAPGEKGHLVVTVQTSDARALVTEGFGGGKVMWSDLKLDAAVATVSEKGVVELAKDPRTSDGKDIQIAVTVPSHPEVRTGLVIPLRYDRAFTSEYQGRPGAPGMDGSSGIDGMPGTMGSSDLSNPQAGGNGGNGTDGGDGQDGWPGGNGPAVHVWVTSHSGHPSLLQVMVKGDRAPEYFLLDPKGGSLTVASSAGPGGSGGRGGRGGQGGMGGTGWPPGTSGLSGRDGRNGMDGSAGRNGQITVSFDPSVEPWISVIRCAGGDASGPASVFVKEPVAQLW